ncbi:MAG: hypothetical protein NWE98_05750 [Candidatus Bathyarchaeota archaeon]|nr:hypothetical protein [Candidatus Bathyarchaeota archaeon]
MGNAQKEIVSYAFKSTEEDITVDCNFINGTLMQLGINSNKGISLSSIQLPSNLIDATKYCYAVGSMGSGSQQPTNPQATLLGPSESTLPVSEPEKPPRPPYNHSYRRYHGSNSNRCRFSGETSKKTLINTYLSFFDLP